jgi:hypothetical protein
MLRGLQLDFEMLLLLIGNVVVQCGDDLPASEFSKSQMNKGKDRKCKECVEFGSGGGGGRGGMNVWSLVGGLVTWCLQGCLGTTMTTA